MRKNGTVKWFNNQKGFGFISLDDESTEVFVHHTAIQGEGFKSLSEGEKVELDVVEDPKGPKAENVAKEPDAWMDSDGHPIYDSEAYDTSPTQSSRHPTRMSTKDFVIRVLVVAAVVAGLVLLFTRIGGM
jgi:CspA family cold shock protein